MSRADQERGSVTGTKRVLLPLLFGLFAAASRIMVSIRSKKISANMIVAPVKPAATVAAVKFRD